MYDDKANKVWKGAGNYKTPDVPTVQDRSTSKVVKEQFEKAKSRKRLTEDIKSLDEWSTFLKDREKAQKNPELKFQPVLKPEVFSPSTGKMVKRPKSLTRIDHEQVNRWYKGSTDSESQWI